MWTIRAERIIGQLVDQFLDRNYPEIIGKSEKYPGHTIVMLKGLAFKIRMRVDEYSETEDTSTCIDNVLILFCGNTSVFYILESQVKESINFIKENDHYFLNLSMPACKAALDAAHGVANSTIVTTMARNGVEFGLRISSMDEDQWFTGPAQMVKGLLFPGYTEEDASPDIGDSTIAETMGLGGFVMGGAPAIVQFVGGTVDDAINYSKQMYEITEGENNNFSIPNLNFRGSAIGIDVMKVIESGRLPIINTGMAHKRPGVGQVGAGVVNPPVECFEKAIVKLSNKIDGSEE